MKPTATASRPDLAKLESVVGYRFTDQDLLRRALTHKSASADNNERLEYLGDAVLGYVVADMLFAGKQFGEDTMTLMRASLVKRDTLAQVAESLRLGDFLVLGAGERKSGGHQRRSILADSFEALLGAIHQDGGLPPARQLIEQLFDPLLQDLDPDKIKDPKTRLQEHLQGSGMALPHYETLQTSGAEHRRVFVVQCRVDELDMAIEASGESRRQAEQAAALGMLEAIRERA